MSESFYREFRALANSLCASTVAFATGLSYKAYVDGTTNTDIPASLLIVLGIVSFWFVFDDWYGSRQIWLRLALPKDFDELRQYPHQAFLLVDITIAFATFPLVLSACLGSRLFIVFFVIVLLLGWGWAAIAFTNRYHVFQGQRDLRLLADLAAVITTHASFAVLVSAYSIAYGFATRSLPDSRFGAFGAFGFSAVVLAFVYLNRRLVPKWTVRVFESLSLTPTPQEPSTGGTSNPTDPTSPEPKSVPNEPDSQGK